LEPESQSEMEFERRQAITDRIDALETIVNLLLQAAAINEALAGEMIFDLQRLADVARKQNAGPGFVRLLRSRAEFLERVVARRRNARAGEL
jgi:hypothetical protein